jgi:hypothetical protein
MLDYVLMSKGLSTNVSSVLIDEKGVFDLNSDHVIISVKLREITQILEKQDSYFHVSHISLTLFETLAQLSWKLSFKLHLNSSQSVSSVNFQKCLILE